MSPAHMHIVTGTRSPANLLEALEQSLREVLYTPDGTAAPVAVLWTDPERQWERLLPRLLQTMPNIFTLGEYSIEHRTGPSIWLRCVADGALDVGQPSNTVPILYLPGVSRQELRSTADCPAYLQPLVELQFRGSVWHQRNGRDWTAAAYFVSEDGLDLDLAQDARTMEALLRSLPLLADVPLRSLRGHRLDAEDFDRLAVADPIRDLLHWIGSERAASVATDENRWQAFRNICKKQFAFDPDEKTSADACTLLIEGSGKWEEAWTRFAEMPRSFAPVEAALLEAKTSLVPRHPERLPKVNEDQEAELCKKLLDVPSLPHAEACAKVLELENSHGKRRDWVWAQLDRSSFASALLPLSVLAGEAVSPCGGSTLDDIVENYVQGGWRCDQAALQALSVVASTSELGVIRDVVRCLYEPWLDTTSRRFQDLITADPGTENGRTQTPCEDDDTCLVFADGLRFDVAQQLMSRLEDRGMAVESSHRLSPLPTVTATAKPVVTLVRHLVEGEFSAEDFIPAMKATGKAATTVRLRDEMTSMGAVIIDSTNPSPRSAEAKFGWCEMGRLDELGHKLGCDLVAHLGTEIERMADCVEAMLDNGWSKVRIVTDHGWLLLPGGLPKTELPPYLVATKWARCASVLGESATDVPTWPWYWNNQARIASPPGIGSFVKGIDYAHGGVSLQECVVPEMTVTRAIGATAATIESVEWRGMRCRVQVTSNTPSLAVDLRLNWKQPGSSIALSKKQLGEIGNASLIVDDEHEGAAATVVVLDDSGTVLDRKPTTVGEGP